MRSKWAASYDEGARPHFTTDTRPLMKPGVSLGESSSVAVNIDARITRASTFGSTDGLPDDCDRKYSAMRVRLRRRMAVAF